MTCKILLPLLVAISVPYLSVAQKADSNEIKEIIDRHNFWRTDVGVSNISYSDELAAVALSWANSLSENCEFKHSQNDYGENLFKGTIGYYSAADAVDSWGDEKKFYDYDTNKCDAGEMCGHYTQIIWSSTTEVGCAKAECDGFVTWVCNYSPPGNYIGVKPY